MIKGNPDISRRQNQILQELCNCDDELSGQDLYRVLHISESSMGLITVYRNLQALIKKVWSDLEIFPLVRFIMHLYIEIYSI